MATVPGAVAAAAQPAAAAAAPPTAAVAAPAVTGAGAVAAPTTAAGTAVAGATTVQGTAGAGLNTAPAGVAGVKTTTAAAAGGTTVNNAFCWCCPGCGCCPADCGCAPGCATLCCVTHDFLVCCGITGCLVVAGAGAGAAGGGGGGGEYGQICGECETNAAILECTECHEIYCQPCYDRIHAKGKWINSGKKGHRATKHAAASVRYLVSEQERNFYMKAEQQCGECSTDDHQVRATVFCLDCKEVYCHACKVKVHSKGLRVKHSRFVPLVAGEDQVEEEHLNRHFPPKPPTYKRGEPRPKWEEEMDLPMAPGEEGDAPDAP